MQPLLTVKSLKARFCRTYYFVNLISSFLIPVLRILQLYPFSHGNFKVKSELKLTALVLCLLTFKLRSSASLEETFGIVFLYLKIANTVLLYCSTTSLFYAALYCIACLAIFALFPQPPYCGPGEVIPLNKDILDTFLSSSKSEGTSTGPQIRVLLLDTLWSSKCLNFQSVVASLSLKYTTPAIKFGHIDLDEDASYGDRFKVDCSATSLQLPTLIMFVNGVEKARLPNARSDALEIALCMWDRSEESIISAFELQKYFDESVASID